MLSNCLFALLQKAAMRACRNAIEFNSIPSIRQIVPGGYDNMQLRVKIGCPRPVRLPAWLLLLQKQALTTCSSAVANF